MSRRIKWWLISIVAIVYFVADFAGVHFGFKIVAHEVLLMFIVLFFLTLPVLYYERWVTVSLVSALLLTINYIIFDFYFNITGGWSVVMAPLVVLMFLAYMIPSWLILMIKKYMSKKADADTVKPIENNKKVFRPVYWVIIGFVLLFYVFYYFLMWEI